MHNGMGEARMGISVVASATAVEVKVLEQFVRQSRAAAAAVVKVATGDTANRQTLLGGGEASGELEGSGNHLGGLE